jgi:hypothetical protein
LRPGDRLLFRPGEKPDEGQRFDRVLLPGAKGGWQGDTIITVPNARPNPNAPPKK